MKINQKGFTLVEGLLIIIALSMVVGVGYYVYTQNRIVPETGALIMSEVSKDQKEKPRDRSYLEIKELGVKFELSEKIADAKYTAVTLSDNTTAVYISVGYFDNLDGFEGCRAIDGGGLVALSSSKIGDMYFGTPLTEDDLKNRFNAVDVNDEYYWFTPNSQAPCFNQLTVNEDNPNVDKISELKRAFTDQQPTITKL